MSYNRLMWTFDQAQQYLFDHIPPSNVYRFPGQAGLNRQKKLLEFLDNPQDKVKVIHVAGTSGKGSTCFLVNKILVDQGFKVGLTLSPHLLDVRERFQISGELITKERFCQVLKDLVPIIDKVEALGLGKLTYFEITVAFAYYLFAIEKVDYAIIETGLGGFLDGTNVVSRSDKISVITRIGHDHIKILGKTLDKIAWQKAQIVLPGSIAFTVEQDYRAMKVIRDVVREKGARLEVVGKKDYKIREIGEEGEIFEFSIFNFQFSDLQLSLLGRHQVENASLAIAVVFHLGQLGKFEIDEKKLRSSLAGARFPGRLDIQVIHGRKVILDGAHNPQKIGALLKALQDIFPGQKFHFILAFKRDKDVGKILKIMEPFVLSFTFTTFVDQGNQIKKQGYVSLAMDLEELKKVVNKLNLQNCSFEVDYREAIKKSVLRKDGQVVVTGSLYLMSEIYSSMCDKI